MLQRRVQLSPKLLQAMGNPLAEQRSPAGLACGAVGSRLDSTVRQNEKGLELQGSSALIE